jgi:outer membrane protein OmpA-like peptidoglycan-associated protein
MPLPRIRLILGTLALIPMTAIAEQYPVNSLTFGINAIPFNVTTLNFPTGLMTTETANTIEFSLPADVLFDFDQANIRPDAERSLSEVAQLLRDKAHGAVLIQGYTDALGTDAYNQRLSERRAAAVKVWLATHEGLSSIRFVTSGLGSRNPVAPNRNPDGSDNPMGRQMNRRVTFIIHR